MHFKPLLGILPFIAVVLLAQCNKNEASAPATAKEANATSPSTAPAAVTPPTPASTPFAPAAARVAAPASSSSSIPLVSEGLSPTFRAVVSKLEVGGRSFSYDEAKGIASWATLLDDLLKIAPEADRKDLPPNFSFAKLFNILGLDAMAAAGSSSRQRADGCYHSRSFAYMPNGRKGLLTLTGGPAAKLLLLDVAPKDTDFGFEFSLNLKDFTRDGMPELMNMVPEADRAKFNEEIAQPIPNVGITTKQVLESLNIRAGLFLRLDPSQKIPLSPDMPAVTGGDALLVVDGMAWLIDSFKPLFMPMLTDPKAPVSLTIDGGVMTVRMKEPVGPPPTDYQPVMRFDAKADRLLIATRPALLDAVLAGSEKFAQRADYADTWRDLPTEGNDCIFVSKRFLDTLGEYVSEGSKSAKTSDSDKLIAQKVLEWSKSLLSHSQAVVLSNQPDGIATFANLAFPVNPSSMSTLTTISTISILASAAVPTFSKIQQKGDQTKEMNNAKQVVKALSLYALDHGGKYPKKLSDLTTSGNLTDATLLEYTDPATKARQEWLFNSKLNDSSPGTELLLASPMPMSDGKRIGAFNDGSVRMITDEEYQRLSAEK